MLGVLSRRPRVGRPRAVRGATPQPRRRAEDAQQGVLSTSTITLRPFAAAPAISRSTDASAVGALTWRGRHHRRRRNFDAHDVRVQASALVQRRRRSSRSPNPSMVTPNSPPDLVCFITGEPGASAGASKASSDRHTHQSLPAGRFGIRASTAQSWRDCPREPRGRPGRSTLGQCLRCGSGYKWRSSCSC